MQLVHLTVLHSFQYEITTGEKKNKNQQPLRYFYYSMQFEAVSWKETDNNSHTRWLLSQSLCNIYAL